MIYSVLNERFCRAGPSFTDRSRIPGSSLTHSALYCGASVGAAECQPGSVSLGQEQRHPLCWEIRADLSTGSQQLHIPSVLPLGFSSRDWVTHRGLTPAGGTSQVLGLAQEQVQSLSVSQGRWGVSPTLLTLNLGVHKNRFEEGNDSSGTGMGARGRNGVKIEWRRAL